MMAPDDFDQHYVRLLKALVGAGAGLRDTRGSVTGKASWEAPAPWIMRLRWPYSPLVTNRKRRLNYFYAVAEWLWMSLGRDEVGSLVYRASRFWRSMPSCFRTARSVPVGMSPGWSGITAERLTVGLCQISWLPLPCRFRTHPSARSFRLSSA